jgi:hypothetical protein
VSAPTQHNSREENETIKEGKTPEDWKSKLAKNHQKDKVARWTKKHERSYFGYNNHIGVDRRHKFVRRALSAVFKGAVGKGVVSRTWRKAQPSPCMRGVVSRGAYSTVTLFARLRGWSASLPMTTAV